MAHSPHETPPSSYENHQWFDENGDYEELPQEEMVSAIERLTIVKNLRVAEDEKNGTPSRGNEFLQKQRLEYHESNPSPYGVTLGIEIEIPKESILPPNSENWKEGEKKKYLRNLKGDYRQTEALGLPSDTDQFWEFAHLPANYPTTLGREVQALIGMNLIPKEYRKFPLHVTIGGITSKTENPKEEHHAHLLARVLDATGWETSGERLMSPYTDRTNSDWTLHDATSGILERRIDRIAQPESGAIPSAVEFRTSYFQNLFGLERYLKSAYYLGSALRAFQNPNKSDQKIKALTRVWKRFADQCESVFEEAELPSPYKLWTLDVENPDEHSPFKSLAKILEKNEKEPNGKESKFVHEIRQLIIEARKEAKEIMG